MNKSKFAFIVAAAGLLGWCSHGKIESGTDKSVNADKPAKIDTALVLGAWRPTHCMNSDFLLVKRDGTTMRARTISIRDDEEFSNVGDTVLVQNSVIIKNLTMENKIKAFTKQR